MIDGAEEMRDRLAELGLESFCKTTGGKGLHVVTPLARPRKGQKLDWATAKQFARNVCSQLASDSPDRYLINMSKAERRGKIFLDYLRNDQFSTAVAPLSPRGRPHAPVSMPIVWALVKRGLDPLQFTIRTVPQLLKKSKAWGRLLPSRTFSPRGHSSFDKAISAHAGGLTGNARLSRSQPEHWPVSYRILERLCPLSSYSSRIFQRPRNMRRATVQQAAMPQNAWRPNQPYR